MFFLFCVASLIFFAFLPFPFAFGHFHACCNVPCLGWMMPSLSVPSWAHDCPHCVWVLPGSACHMKMMINCVPCTWSMTENATADRACMAPAAPDAMQGQCRGHVEVGCRRHTKGKSAPQGGFNAATLWCMMPSSWFHVNWAHDWSRCFWALHSTCHCAL